MTKYTKYTIYVVHQEKMPFVFIGKYRRDLETKNWHYYETEDGGLYHFKKEHMVAVFGGDAKSVI